MWFDLIPVVAFTCLFLHPASVAGMYSYLRLPKLVSCPADLIFAEQVWNKTYVEPYSPEKYNETSTVPRKLPGISYTAYGPLAPPQCGFSNVSHSRVVGGTQAPLGAWPWMALLGYCPLRSGRLPKWKCGGVLVSQRHVITAAHCVTTIANLYVVRLGELDLTTETDRTAHLDVKIEKAIVHPQFRSRRTVNDIAVLRLANVVTFTSDIRPICLPVSAEMRTSDFGNTFPYLAGWGRSGNSSEDTKHLMEVQVPVSSKKRCAELYESVEGVAIDDRVICTGEEEGGKDACRGDSGGPVMLPKGQYFYAIGVVSYGIGCGDPKFPGVHIKVGHYMDFIMKHLV